MNNNEKLNCMRHSAAHLLAQAVLELFPGTKLTIGPTTETGFFYDFLPTQNFKEEDLERIEQKMHELAKKDYKIDGKQVSKKEALKLFAGNQFKEELINGITDDAVGIYSQGDFFDLCKGGHVHSTGEIKYFKLIGISGSYWRADREGQALQRIAGVAFLTKQDMDDYLKRIEEAKLYDHRRLGKQLDLFFFDEQAPGMPFFMPKGLAIFNKLIEYERKIQKGVYEEIKTPIIMNETLWHTSGHYANYKENMYFTNIDKIPNCVKPMNCPGGLLVYKQKPRSYKDLPLRFAEVGLVHRHELSGVLHGLFRVRAFHQDDAHIYCTPEQIEQEVIGVLNLDNSVYKKFGFKKVKYALSTRPEKYIGSIEVWDIATKALIKALEGINADYKINEGDGAFYGPKIDLLIEDAMGREWQCGTIQVDFFMPKNFGAEYIKSDQTKATPVMLHRVIYGSLERFLGIILEHFKGRLPLWLAPVQARILTITDQQKEYAQSLSKKFSDAGVRVEIDNSGDQISGQIRQAQEDKVCLMLVLGKKEQEGNTITLRYPDGKQEFGLTAEQIIELVNKE